MNKKTGKIKAVMLDRDGTLNLDDGFTYKTQDLKLFPDVIDALKLLKNNFIFFIVTNQSGIGRGYFTLEDVNKFNDKMILELKKENINIEKIYICPHTPEGNCDCRKPSTKYINQAAKEFNIDLKNSWVIGDHPCDVEMGINAGCKAVYLTTGHGKNHFDELKKENIKPNFTAENFMQAAEFILNNKTND